MKNKTSRYTEEELQFIRDNCAIMSDKAIGQKLNRNYRGVETQRIKMDMVANPDHKSVMGNRYSLRTKAFAYELYCQGNSLKDIGLSIGVSAVTIYRWINLFLPFVKGKKAVIVMQSKINGFNPFSDHNCAILEQREQIQNN